MVVRIGAATIRASHLCSCRFALGGAGRGVGFFDFDPGTARIRRARFFPAAAG
jgi:hypothetical protein